MNTVASEILALSLLALTLAHDGIARGDEVPVSGSRLQLIQQELKTLPKRISLTVRVMPFMTSA
ncbi:MAG TPA: hypothetical protein DCY79_08495 [Planctomycetaceae bacterium]|nr:hypothetical protein [Blastopirellula sp.]HAY79830.1 hypothetical protein [Planctomycetaceae bacterium]|tara:strand:- start:355 stop:546 length:192 start_codon:yes stop_codon:yes gene_type:complete